MPAIAKGSQSAVVASMSGRDGENRTLLVVSPFAAGWIVPLRR